MITKVHKLFPVCKDLSIQWREFCKSQSIDESKVFLGGSDGKASVCNEGDLGSIPGSGRSPGEGNGNPLQYSCLENSMDGGGWWATVHRVAKSRTQLSDFASLRTRSAGSQGHLGVWLPRSPPPLVEEERNMREHLPSSGEPLPRRL